MPAWTLLVANPVKKRSKVKARTAKPLAKKKATRKASSGQRKRTNKRVVRRVARKNPSDAKGVYVMDGNRKVHIANPLEWEHQLRGPGRRTGGLFKFAFGAYGTFVAVWGSDLDSALEDAAVWLSDHAPGMFTDSDEIARLEREHGEVVDHTYTESGWIPSWEWRVSELYSGPLFRDALVASVREYVKEYGELSDSDARLYRKALASTKNTTKKNPAWSQTMPKMTDRDWKVLDLSQEIGRIGDLLSGSGGRVEVTPRTGKIALSRLDSVSKKMRGMRNVDDLRRRVRAMRDQAEQISGERPGAKRVVRRVKKNPDLPFEKPQYKDDFIAGFVAGKKAFKSDIRIDRTDASKAYRKVSSKHGSWWVDGFRAAIEVGRGGAYKSQPVIIARALGLTTDTDDEMKARYKKWRSDIAVMPQRSKKMTKRRSPSTKTRKNGATEARELRLFIDNDADLYRQRYVPILKNQVRKKLSRKYDASKSPKIWSYLVDDGAKKYARTFARASEWSRIFDVKTRKGLAEEYARDFESQFRSGELDWIIDEVKPKKMASLSAEQIRSGVTTVSSSRSRTIASPKTSENPRRRAKKITKNPRKPAQKLEWIWEWPLMGSRVAANRHWYAYAELGRSGGNLHLFPTHDGWKVYWETTDPYLRRLEGEGYISIGRVKTVAEGKKAAAKWYKGATSSKTSKNPRGKTVALSRDDVEVIVDDAAAVGDHKGLMRESRKYSGPIADAMRFRARAIKARLEGRVRDAVVDEENSERALARIGVSGNPRSKKVAKKKTKKRTLTAKQKAALAKGRAAMAKKRAKKKTSKRGAKKVTKRATKKTAKRATKKTTRKVSKKKAAKKASSRKSKTALSKVRQRGVQPKKRAAAAKKAGVKGKKKRPVRLRERPTAVSMAACVAATKSWQSPKRGKKKRTAAQSRVCGPGAPKAKAAGKLLSAQKKAKTKGLTEAERRKILASYNRLG